MELAQENNQPVIHVNYIQSSDVRDKMVKLFLEEFAAESTFAFCRFLKGDPDKGATIEIVPIFPSKDCIRKYFSQCGGEHLKMIVEVGQELIASYPKQSE